MRRLINAAANPRDRAILKLFYATGCRLGELVNIGLEHVDFARRTILVRGKSGDRRVFFGFTAKRNLREHLRGRKAGYLSTDKVGPVPIYCYRTNLYTHSPLCSAYHLPRSEV